VSKRCAAAEGEQKNPVRELRLTSNRVIARTILMGSGCNMRRPHWCGVPLDSNPCSPSLFLWFFTESCDSFICSFLRWT
jgi:hypothetical protein